MGKAIHFNLEGVRKLRNHILGLFFFVLILLTQGAEPEDVTFAIVILGMLIRIWASGYLIKKKELTMSGPYGYIRNPLYTGTFIIGLGLCIVQRSLFFLVLYLAIFLFVYYFQIKHEEKVLNEKFGEEYREYCRNVPRFFPRFTRYIGPAAGSEGGFSLSNVWKNKGIETLALVILLFLVLEIKEDFFLPLFKEHRTPGEIILHYFRYLF